MAADPTSVFVSAYVDPEMASALKARAVSEDRSLAAELRRAIRQYVSPKSETRPDTGSRITAGQGRDATG